VTRRPPPAHAAAVWLNGRIVRAAAARLRVSDRGLLYGDGLFETLRVYSRHPFLLAAHLGRMRRSARRLGIPFPGDAAYWDGVIRRLCAANGLRDAAVRLTITRGVGPGLLPGRGRRPTLLVEARRLDPALSAARARGIAVAVLPFGRGDDFLAAHKTLAYLPAVLGRREAARRGLDDALYLGADGTVTEATTANLFVCHGRRVRTPRAGILPGITRAIVLDLARRLGHVVEERPVPRDLLRSAAEVFLTSSVAEIRPVVRIESRVVGAGVPGPVTRALQAAYRARVLRAIRRRGV
jgi:branched-subunit amino acid aminotransferase/4-amino-4-deoxychorismate lyase